MKETETPANAAKERATDGGPTSTKGKKALLKRMASLSFWLIAAAHIAAFTAIGLLTDRGWRLLIIFLCGFALILAGVAALKFYRARKRNRREK